MFTTLGNYAILKLVNKSKNMEGDKMKIQFRCKLKEILVSRNLSQKEFAEMTGLREATISELIRDARISYNRTHLATCMEALGLKNISDIIETIHVKEREG